MTLPPTTPKDVRIIPLMRYLSSVPTTTNILFTLNFYLTIPNAQIEPMSFH